MRRTVSAAFTVLFLLVEIAQIYLCANSTNPCREAEREALLKWRASLDDPSNTLSSWEGIHCCQWKGVACDNVTGHVVKLDLWNPCFPPSWPKEEFYDYPEKCFDDGTQQLQAQNLDPSLLQLEYLTYLDLSGNDFSFPIPTFFGSMQRLQYLSLSFSGFNGTIPSSLGNLKNLLLLDLSENYKLEANDTNWISQLESLEHLDMSGVNLADSHNLFQVLNMLPSLLRLYLFSCELPNSLIPLTKVQILALGGNQFTLPVLHAFQNMTSLVQLYLSRNEFNGPIPNAFRNLTSVEFLDLSENNITSIPSWFHNFDELVHLDLSYNGLHGPIPNTFQNTPSIEFLDLAGNYFTSIPPWFRNFEKLKFLDLSCNGPRDTPEMMDCESFLPIRSYHSGFGGANPDASKNTSSLVYLDLSRNGLRAPILDGFRNTTSIRFLGLSLNDITSIPSWFDDFDKLVYLDLSGNSFHGPIPNTFQNMLSIEFLDLSGNYFASIPPWFRNFEKLKFLDLSCNGPHDTDEIMEYCQSLWLYRSDRRRGFGGANPDASRNTSSLVYLDLSSNGLLGPIPDCFINTTSLEILYLTGNKYPSIPSWFGNFDKLVHLDLSMNMLHGPIPEAFRNMSSIEFLDLSYNEFTLVPSWFAELKSLVDVDLHQNNLTCMECSLSSILGNMCHLRRLYLSGNKLQGEPFGRYELSGCIRYDLEELDLQNNDLSDRLLTWLGKLENLRYLDLSSNFFHGPIPFSLEKLSKLRQLDLSNNELNGSLPHGIGELVDLQDLNLSSNKFSGFIPQNLGKIVNLYSLDLSDNFLNGSVPQNIYQVRHLDLSSNNLDGIIYIGGERSSITKMQHLNLANNQISGSLHTNIGHIMPHLYSLILGNNLINGSIPVSLCQIKQLVNLDLSKNNLSGEIPNCWKESKILEEINLSSNTLSGVFPSSLGNISSLWWLHLNNNNIQGRLPVSFTNLGKLLILDLGENQFSGRIPPWSRNTFPSLQILRLRQNILTGKIPSQLCQLTSLKILDLSRNKLEGSIPLCIGNLTGMALNKSSNHANEDLVSPPYNSSVASAPESEWYKEEVKEVMKGTELVYIRILKLVVNMDLSENNLVGSIPNEITWLTGLHGLNLANNNLKGEIPKKIGDMESLESLDMSHNLLSGIIPDSISALTSLSHLNLSHNNLSGQIPEGNQLSTLDDPSIYGGNPYLCGSPLPNKCPGNDSQPKGNESDDGDKDKVERIWLFFAIAAGFATGFWGVIGTLWFNKSFRLACFGWVDKKADEIYVSMVIKMAKLTAMRTSIHR